jgi:NADH:ubiquinone oxidoreductase subunit 3 (subunit A)
LLSDFGLVALLLILGVLFTAALLGLSFALSYTQKVKFLHLKQVRPDNPTPEKVLTYECGRDPIGPSWFQFNFRYYLYALVFVVFDVETVFLYPWAVRFSALKWFGFVEMIVFILILLVGYAYAWKKKALEWV